MLIVTFQEMLCYWPNEKQALSAKRKEMPDKQHWQKYKIRILSYTGRYFGIHN